MTGAGVLECKNVLEETEGDLEKAAQVLRERGLAKADKRQECDSREPVVRFALQGILCSAVGRSVLTSLFPNTVAQRALLSQPTGLAPVWSR